MQATALAEFELIRRLMELNPVKRDDVILGIGDDAAVVTVPSGYDLVVTVDTLNSGIHFPSNTSANAIAYKSLAVNLSDLAAMGAEPAWVTLSLCLPEANLQWIDDFALGFYSLAKKYNVQLIGGDTTQGPLSISVQAQGFVPHQQSLRRSGAHVGDYICVTGTLGDAGFELYCLENNIIDSDKYARLEYPSPRIETGLGLRGIATSAIDISDGLISDLGHVLSASKVGAHLQLEKIPRSEKLCAFSDQAKTYEFALGAGDDYELCFTVPESKIEIVNKLQAQTGVAISHIGNITAGSDLLIFRENGAPIEITKSGYQHFTDGNL